MNKTVRKFLNIAEELKAEDKDIFYLVKKLKENKATLAITIRVLNEMGYDSLFIEEVLDKSPEWKDVPWSHQNLFADFVELDDDLADDDE